MTNTLAKLGHWLVRRFDKSLILVDAPCRVVTTHFNGRDPKAAKAAWEALLEQPQMGRDELYIDGKLRGWRGEL